MKIKHIQKFYPGITLIETFVAISILIIGMTGVTTLFINSWRQNAYTLEMGQDAMAASQGVSKMIGYLREAREGDDGSYPVVSADDNDLVVFSDYDKDGVTERLHFYKNGQNLMMGIRKPNSTMPVTYASGDATTITVASHIVNISTMPVFAYYDANYPEDSVNNPITTPASVPKVRLVRVELHINIDPNRPPDNVQIRSFAEMRNLNDHDRFGL